MDSIIAYKFLLLVNDITMAPRRKPVAIFQSPRMRPARLPSKIGEPAYRKRSSGTPRVPCAPSLTTRLDTKNPLRGRRAQL